MLTINYSSNWNNKLLNDYHTHIFKPGVYKPGDVVQETFKGDPVNICVVEKVRSFKLKELGEFTAYLDAGYSKESIQKLLSDNFHRNYVAEHGGGEAVFDLILLKVTERIRGTFHLLLSDAMKRYDKLIPETVA